VSVLKGVLKGVRFIFFSSSWPSWSTSRNTPANTLFYLAAKALGAGRLISLQSGADRRELIFRGIRSDECAIRLGTLSATLAQLPVGGTRVQ